MTQILTASALNSLGKITGNSLYDLQSWCGAIKHLMLNSPSTYAEKRMEFHIRHFVSLEGSKSTRSPEVKKINRDICAGVDRVENLGERLLPGFHQGLVLFYPKGSRILPHRDASVYAQGAAQVNVRGDAIFSISEHQDTRKMDSYLLKQGDCIAFNNKQPHGIAPVEEDRWCICFFKLKAEFLPGNRDSGKSNCKQLSLF